jgi:hypothetical protein
MVKVIEEFLPKEEFNTLQKDLLSNEFPWYYLPCVVTGDDRFQFVHQYFIQDNWLSDNKLIMPILKKLNPLTLVSLKINCQPKTEKIIYNKPHVDFPVSSGKMKTAIYYINSNDGKSIIGSEEICSVANKMVIFDTSITHQGTTSTDDRRVVMNINYISWN